jgi:hypothetical protein
VRFRAGGAEAVLEQVVDGGGELPERAQPVPPGRLEPPGQATTAASELVNFTAARLAYSAASRPYSRPVSTRPPRGVL